MNKIPLYGCPECGRFGWTRQGERVDGAGEEGGRAYVRKIPKQGGTGRSWVGDCGHELDPASPLARCLDELPLHGAGPLVENRPVEMNEMPPSALW
jgi:hypothetical protein